MFCKISSITEILYGINSNEALKSSLSKAAFPVYYGDWLFNLQMTQYMESEIVWIVRIEIMIHFGVWSNNTEKSYWEQNSFSNTICR